ncbi:hypothetical protein R6Q59_004505 [Mikania micrantha]
MKKAIKKTLMMKIVKKEDEVKEPECYEDKTKSQNMVGSSNNTTTKKKIIKKVTKKKVAAKVNKDKMVKKIEAGSIFGEQHATEPKLENIESVSEAVPQSTGGSNDNKREKIEVKEEKKAKVEGGSDKNEKLKDGKEKKDKAVKTETKVKEVKDKRKVEEPPRHPGFILQTKGSNNSKLRSLSLSLDSLLDYTDKDIQESTFELSVFAETFYEMLQFQMGSRILTFLQKLRIKFVTKRNRKKRRREEASDKKEKDKTSPAKKSSPKRQKTDDVTVESVPVKTEKLDESGPVDEKPIKDENMVIDNNVENIKAEDPEEDLEEDPEEDPEEESEEDPEEDPEEDENMADVVNEEKAEMDKVDTDIKSESVDERLKGEQEENFKTTENLEKKEKQKVDTQKKETSVVIDKKLLQAFRFFDRNRMGYIRVEDLRLILHALGNCMSNRDVKELVLSALLESNTGRDDHILYNKLVKMTDI